MTHVHSFGQRARSGALALLCAFISFFSACQVHAAVGPDGQLWYTLGNAFIPPNPIAHINSDGSGQADAQPTTFVSGIAKGTVNLAVDPAAGFYWVVDTATGPSIGTHSTDPTACSIIEYRISDNSQVGVLKIGDDADQDMVQAIVVDPIHHVLYVQEWGFDQAHSGVEKVTYDPVTGAMTGGFANPVFVANNTGFSALSDVRYLAIDVPNQQLYVSDNDNGYCVPPFSPTNSVYRIDLNAPAPVIPVQLTSTADVFGGFPPGAASTTGCTGGGSVATVDPRGLIGAVAIDSSTQLVYVLTHSFCSASATSGDCALPANQHPDQSTLWWVNSTGPANQLGTQVIDTSTGTGIRFFYPGEFGGMSFDPQTRQLYITDQNQSGTNTGHIRVYQLSLDGKSATPGQIFNITALTGEPNPDPFSIPQGSTFLVLPKLTLAGTGTHAVEQSLAITALSSQSIVDLDGDHLRGATVQITGGTFSSNETSNNDDHLTVGGATSGTVPSTSITIAYSTATETLTLSGYDTIAHYQTALSQVQFNSTGDNPTNGGANTTRTVTWTVSDGLPNIPAGSQNSGTTTLTIDAVDDPPVNVVPGAQTVAVNANLPIAGLSTSDVDAGSGGVTSTLSVVNGTLNVTAAGGATVSASGASVTVSGTLAQVNATLSGAGNVVFHSATPGTETLTFTTNDNGNTGSGGPLTDTKSVTIAVVAPPTISKAFGASSIPVFGATSLSFQLLNPGANTVAETGVTFTDNLPSGLEFIPGSAPVCGGTVTLTMNSISLSGATIPVGTPCGITVTVTGITPGVQNNTTGAVSSSNGGTGTTSNTASIIVVAPPTYTKAFGTPLIALNGTTTLTFALSNPNTAIALSNVAFTDAFPSGVAVAPTPNIFNSCGGTFLPLPGDTTVSLSGGALSAGSPCTISVAVQGTSSGIKNNTGGAISSNESGQGVASNTATLTVANPPSLSALFGATSMPLNQSTTLTFTITNNNTGINFSGLSFSSTLPSGLQLSAPSNTCGGSFSTNAATGQIQLTSASLTSGSTCTISVTVTGTTAGSYPLTSGAQSDQGNGSASASIDVVAPPSIAMAFNPTLVLPNTTSSLQFTLTNPAGNSETLSGVTFTDTLPAGLTVATATTSACSGTLVIVAPSSITLTGASIAIGDQCLFTVTVTPTTASLFSNTTGTVMSTNGGPGNTASATLSSQATTLAVTFDDSHSYARNGQMLDYVLKISNTGTVDANDVSVVQTLSPEFDSPFETWTCINGGGGTQCVSQDTGPLNDTSVVIPAGRTLTWLISVPVRADASGDTADNTIAVSSASDPGSPHNVLDSDTLVVFRDGFDVPYADGTQSISATLKTNQSLMLTLPDAPGKTPVDTVLAAFSDDGSGFRIERLNLTAAPRVRIVAVGADGSEKAGNWTQTGVSAQLAVGLADQGGSLTAVLESANEELLMPLSGAAQTYRLRSLAGGE